MIDIIYKLRVNKMYLYGVVLFYILDIQYIHLLDNGKVERNIIKI